MNSVSLVALNGIVSECGEMDRAAEVWSVWTYAEAPRSRALFDVSPSIFKVDRCD